MISAKEAQDFIQWYCDLRGEKNHKQYTFGITVNFTGIVRYSAHIKSGDKTVELSDLCSDPYFALCFIVVAAFRKQANNYLPDANGYSPAKYAYDMMQDAKMGGEPGLVVEAIGIMLEKEIA
jgi:hypothetical protein